MYTLLWTSAHIIPDNGQVYTKQHVVYVVYNVFYYTIIKIRCIEKHGKRFTWFMNQKQGSHLNFKRWSLDLFPQKYTIYIKYAPTLNKIILQKIKSP